MAFPQETLGLIPDAYFQGRRIAAFRLAHGFRLLDLRSVETHADLRVQLAATLTAVGYRGTFNFGEVIGADYGVTQQIAQWAYDAGYDGIVYASAHDHALSCWARFENVTIVPAGTPQVILPDDPDFIAAAELFGLTVPG